VTPVPVAVAAPVHDSTLRSRLRPLAGTENAPAMWGARHGRHGAGFLGPQVAEVHAGPPRLPLAAAVGSGFIS
jgi:hypothetical protein